MRTVDLFGFETVLPPNLARQRVRPEAIRRAQATKRLNAARYSSNLDLFTDLLEFLKAPLLSAHSIPVEYRSDRNTVDLHAEVESGAEEGADVDIPYEPWGSAVVEDQHGLSWSREGLIAFQCNIFWESMEEMTLSNNEGEKWSVIKWVFQPALVKQYIWDKRVGRSHCLTTHERNHPFSFHNCAMAARMDADIIREGFRRNLPAAILQAVAKVVTY